MDKILRSLKVSLRSSVIICVFAGGLLLFILRDRVLLTVSDLLANMRPIIHREEYAVGDIKDALSQSCRLAISIQDAPGQNKAAYFRLIQKTLRGDKWVIAVKVSYSNDIVEYKSESGEECGFRNPTWLPGEDGPILEAREGKRLNVYRPLLVGSNKVGTLSMRRETQVKVTADDIDHFEQYGDGGR